MPSRIDHAARREAIAEAAWRIILRDGLDAVSVRAVAAEAGLSTGSLRHIFSSQAELLQFSMELVGDRVRARVAAIAAEASSRERIVRMISEILPLDAVRAAEQEVWLAFVARSRVEPSMRDFVTQIDEAQRNWLRSALDAMFAEEGIGDRDPALECERLYALMDGLVLHLIVTPGSLGADQATAVLTHHLTDLRAQPAPPQQP